jgi:hypothetical protein
MNRIVAIIAAGVLAALSLTACTPPAQPLTAQRSAHVYQVTPTVGGQVYHAGATVTDPDGTVYPILLSPTTSFIASGSRVAVSVTADADSSAMCTILIDGTVFTPRQTATSPHTQVVTTYCSWLAP